MEKIMSTHISDRGVLRLYHNDNTDYEYMITFTPPSMGSEDEVLIYEDHDKADAGMKFFQLCNGVIRIESELNF